MKKYIPLLAVSLFSCLFIYVFYRTDRTLINQVVMALLSEERYFCIKSEVTSLLPLGGCFVYSLPEGLWVYCITLTSSFFYLDLLNKKFSLVFAPILLALGMELFQLLNVTNGRFDWMDIAFAFGGWVLALVQSKTNPGVEPLFRSFNANTAFFMASYSIVYLAHVNY